MLQGPLVLLLLQLKWWDKPVEDIKEIVPVLTCNSLSHIKEELRNLIEVVRDDVKRQLAEARAQGDLSENADYDAARNRQAEVEGRIKEIENILANADIIEEGKASTKKVGLGSTVTIRFVDNGKEVSYMIVGTVESDPVNGKISNSCPLGEALVGKNVGDIVEVKAIKTYKVEILKIEIK